MNLIPIGFFVYAIQLPLFSPEAIALIIAALAADVLTTRWLLRRPTRGIDLLDPVVVWAGPGARKNAPFASRDAGGHWSTVLAMLTCRDCGRGSSGAAWHWIGVLVARADRRGDEVALYCPRCAEARFAYFSKHRARHA
jgi:hypothetical protein